MLVGGFKSVARVGEAEVVVVECPMDEDHHIFWHFSPNTTITSFKASRRLQRQLHGRSHHPPNLGGSDAVAAGEGTLFGPESWTLPPRGRAVLWVTAVRPPSGEARSNSRMPSWTRTIKFAMALLAEPTTTSFKASDWSNGNARTMHHPLQCLASRVGRASGRGGHPASRPESWTLPLKGSCRSSWVTLRARAARRGRTVNARWARTIKFSGTSRRTPPHRSK